MASHQPRFVFLASTVLVFAVVILTATIGEDPFITFRVVDNAVHGYGLRWNVDERVQVSTEPLWLLLHIPLYAVTDEIYVTSSVTAALTTALAFWVAARPLASRPLTLAVVFLVPWLGSVVVPSYAGSGYAHPLCYLAVALYLSRFPLSGTAPVPWGWLSTCAALAGLSRLDTLFVIAPSLGYLVATRWHQVRWRELVLGQVPLASWFAFSIAYFGFVLPNTDPAKIHSAIPLVARCVRGGAYFLDFFLRSPLAAFAVGAVVVGACVALWRVARARDWEDQRAHFASLGLGIFAHAAYLFYVGGDWVAAKQWAVPTFFALALTARWFATARVIPAPRLVGLGVTGALLGALSVLAYRGLLRTPGVWYDGVLLPNERHIRTSNLLAHYLSGGSADVQAVRAASTIPAARREFAIPARFENDRGFVRASFIGYRGFHGGPQLRLVDPWGIVDPFVARLTPQRWSPGHLFRELPPRYAEVRFRGELHHLPAPAREYYGALRTIASDPVWSTERLRVLLRFRWGAFDSALETYERQRAEASDYRLEEPPMKLFGSAGSRQPTQPPVQPRGAQPAE